MAGAKLFFNDQPMLGEIEMRLTKQKIRLKGLGQSIEARKEQKTNDFASTLLLASFFLGTDFLLLECL